MRSFNRAVLGLFVIVVGTLCCADGVFAASGDADPSFGLDGVAFVDFTPVAGAPGNTYAAATALDAKNRIWVAASVVGSSTAGLGLARLTPSGQLDTTFGTGGLRFVAAPPLNSDSLIGLRIGGDGKVYVAYQQGSGAFAAWYVCRIAADGSFDTSFFGGCAGASPADDATPHDLLISPYDGSVWVLGTELDSTTHTQAPAIAQFDVMSNVIRSETFPVAFANVDVLAGAISSGSGELYLTGAYTATGGNTDILLAAIGATGSSYNYQILTSVAFDVGGSLSDIGNCIVLTPDSGYLIGAATDSGINGTYWSSVKLTYNGQLDTNYGNGGKSVHLIADPELGLNYAVNDCAVSADGALNMVGTYYFTDPGVSASAQAATIYRMLPSGVPDPDFGGAAAVPGMFYTLEYPGTVLDYYRPVSASRPRTDTAEHVHATLPHTGSMLIDGVSRRTDGTSNGDAAVMRILGDDIFNDSLE